MQKKPSRSIEMAEILAWCKALNREQIQKLPFQKPVFDSCDNRFLLLQAECYRLAKRKLPALWKENTWIFPDKTAAEQCSAQWIAEIRLQLLPRKFDVWADVSAGLGIDSFYAAPYVEAGWLFETEHERADCLKKNLHSLLPGKFRIEEDNFLSFCEKEPGILMGSVLIYADPDRRPSLERTATWKDSSPGLEALWMKAKQERQGLLVKLSPMEDLEELLALFPFSACSWVISIHNEVKELMIYWPPEWQEIPHSRFALDIRQSNDYQMIELPVLEEIIEEKPALPGHYLLDPWASIRKGFQSFGWAFSQGYACVSRKGQLFSSPSKPEFFPGRIFRIEGVSSDLKSLLAKSPVRAFQVVARAFPQTAEELQKKFEAGGDGNTFLFAFRSERQENCFISAIRE
jgi:hypothetical protein